MFLSRKTRLRPGNVFIREDEKKTRKMFLSGKMRIRPGKYFYQGR